MRYIKCLAIYLLLICSACQSEFEMSDRDKKANRMIVDFASTMIDKGLHAAGIGGGINHATGKYKLFSVTFIAENEIADVTEARILFVNTIESFLNYINNRSDIRDDLDVFPVTIENVDVGIFRRDAASNTIANMGHCGSYLYYCAKNSGKPDERLWDMVHEETFEEAQALVYRLSDLLVKLP